MSEGPRRDDVHIVQCALEGEPRAVLILQDACRGDVRRYLLRAGASEGEAHDITESLLVDSLTPRGDRPPLLEKYRGRVSVIPWLKSVALNALIDRRRRLQRFVELNDAVDATIYRTTGEAPSSALSDEPLLSLLRNALMTAFERRSGCEIVMLHLHYIHGVSRRQLASLWQWHHSSVSRLINAANDAIKRDTLSAVREKDPWLELEWNDYLELAGTADLAFW